MSQNRKRANQQNAQKSTGPKTRRGKLIASQNSLKHGLRAKHAVVFDEDPSDFEELNRSLHASLNPENPLQERLVDRVSVCIWRLNRIPKLEAGTIEYQLLRSKFGKINSKINDLVNPSFQLGLLAAAKMDTTSDSIPSMINYHEQDQRKIEENMEEGNAIYGAAFCRDISTDRALEKLVQYETQLSRELFRTLSELERLQAKGAKLNILRK